MTAKPIYKCLTKGTRNEAAEPRASFNWMVARRGFFEVFDDRVECGDWQIAYADVREATLFRFRHMFMNTSVIQLDTVDGTFQFGFNPWASPADHIALDFQEKDVTFTYSTFSKVLRVLAVLWVMYWIWHYLLR